MDVTMANKPEGIASLMVYADDDEEDEPEEGEKENEKEEEEDDDDDDDEDEDEEEDEEEDDDDANKEEDKVGGDKHDQREIRMGEEKDKEGGLSEKEEEGEISEDEEDTEDMDMEVDDSTHGEEGEMIDSHPALPPIQEVHAPTPSPPPVPPPPPPPLLPNRSDERGFTPPAPSVSPSSSSEQPISQPHTRLADVSVLGIVDYEGGASPDMEDGEIESDGVVVMQDDGAVSVRRPTPGSVRIISPGLVVTPREDDGNAAADASQGDQALGTPFNGSLRHSPLVRMQPPASPNGEEGTSSRKQDIEDPLESFLPPPTTEKCPEHLQRKFKDFLDLKASGVDFNKSIMEKKDYRNPDFLERVVRYHNIDEKGSCYPKDKFDPHGYDPNDYYDRLAYAQKRDYEKREQDRQKSGRVEFVRGSVQPSTSGVASASKPAPMQVIPNVQKVSATVAASTSAPSGATAAVAATAVAPLSTGAAMGVSGASKADASRCSKRSKWDKVEPEGGRLPPSSATTIAHDPISAAAAAAARAQAHVVTMTASVGGGYASYVP